MVRHDLANVLTGISFYSSHIAADLPPGTSTEEANAIGDAVLRSARLLEQMRDLWREASEREVVPLDPAAVVDAMTPLLAAAALPVALTVDRLDSMVVRASRRALEESVLSLVVDAREAAGARRDGAPGSIRIRVAAEELREGNPAGVRPGPYAAVSVDGDAPTPDEAVAGSPGASGPTAHAAAGEPGFGRALAAAGARVSGGGLRAERTGEGRACTTLLLPVAVSRRRSDAGTDGRGDDHDPGGGPARG